MKGMGPLKVLALDGFQVIFFQKTCGLVGTLVISFVQGILEGGEFEGKLTKSIMVLILKKENPCHITDYCPISLCNVVFKLVTKTIVKRLKSNMEKVVPSNQCSFVHGRYIRNNIIICQEITYMLKSKHGRKGGLILKIDLEKAYDRLEWTFIK